MAWHINPWRRNLLENEAIPQHIWQKLIQLQCLKGMSQNELRRLHTHTLLFMHDKVINGAHDFEITDEMRVAIAVQACVPILNLGLDYYDDWIEIIVYLDDFILDYEYTDEAGIVHHSRETASGEAWLSGPIIISWRETPLEHTGLTYNVIIHEFAHKLDMRHEGANGCPPLHADMSARTWHDVFNQAYTKFCQHIEAGLDPAIDTYAAESPAEFFAVLSEVFFESPLTVKHHFSAVYEQLSLFYRQNPADRRTNYPAL